MVYFPLLTPSNTSRSSSEMHLLGKYISMALIPTFCGLAGMSKEAAVVGMLCVCEVCMWCDISDERGECVREEVDAI